MQRRDHMQLPAVNFRLVVCFAEKDRRLAGRAPKNIGLGDKSAGRRIEPGAPRVRPIRRRQFRSFQV